MSDGLITSRAVLTMLVQMHVDIQLFFDDKVRTLLDGLLLSLSSYPSSSEQGSAYSQLLNVQASIAGGAVVDAITREMICSVLDGEKARFRALIRAESAGAINSVARRAI